MTVVITEMQHVQTSSEGLFHKCAPSAWEKLPDLRDPSFGLSGPSSACEDQCHPEKILWQSWNHPLCAWVRGSSVGQGLFVDLRGLSDGLRGFSVWGGPLSSSLHSIYILFTGSIARMWTALFEMKGPTSKLGRGATTGRETHRKWECERG